LVKTSTGEKRLLKFSNSTEDPGVTNFQTTAFLHVAQIDPGLVVSRVLPSLDGSYEIPIVDGDGNSSTVRLFNWIEGVAMIDIPEDDRPDNAKEMGGWLARMAKALQGFEHRSMDYEILWDIRQVEKLEPFLEQVDDPFLHDFVVEQMEIFKSSVKPSLNKLSSQVIFNDMSLRNYIVDPDDPAFLKGFIDFGDMINAPRIMDITIACVYWVNDAEDPFTNVVEFLQGYNEHHNLDIDELAILQDLMLCRCMTQVLIYYWRSNTFPENKEYIMQNLKQVKKTINNLSALDRKETLNKFATDCGLTNV